MKFSNTPYSGSSFIDQGEIMSTYHELVAIFGKPYFGPGKEPSSITDITLHRKTCQWRLKYEDGTIALIYDDRQKETNFGLYRWRVGGYSGRSIQLVRETMNEYKAKASGI